MNAAVRSPQPPRRRRTHAGLSASLAAAALLALTSGAARAQETREYDLPELDQDVREETSYRELVKLGFKTSNRFVGMADFGDYRANSYQPEARVKVTVPVAKNAGIRLMATGRILHYDFSESDADLAIGTRSGGPFDDLWSWNARLQSAVLAKDSWTLFTPSERWSLLMEAFVRASWEKSAQMSDALTGGGSLALGYRLGRKLELAAGVSMRSSLRSSRIVFRPIVEFDWHINKDWKLSSQGLGLKLERRLGERFTVFTRARWESQGYRLDDRGLGIGKANLRIRQLPAGLGLEWNVGRHLRVTTLGGVMAIHKLIVEDEDGNELDTDTAKPSPYFLVRFDFKT